MKKLTYLQKKEYIKNGGVRCPYCGSTNIDGDKLFVDDFNARQKVQCNDCEQKWIDIYKLDDIIEV